MDGVTIKRHLEILFDGTIDTFFNALSIVSNSLNPKQQNAGMKKIVKSSKQVPKPRKM
jgi:hypothetical protein